MKIQKPPRPPARACIPAPVTSEAAGRGLWTRLCSSRCPEHPVVPHKPPCPALPIPLSGIYKHFPQINICIDYSLCASRVSLVIQPGRVSSQRLLQLHTKKSTEGEKDPDLTGLTAASHGDGWRGRKKENGEGRRRNEGAEERKQEQENKVIGGELMPGHAGSLEKFPALCSPFSTQMWWTYCSGSEK